MDSQILRRRFLGIPALYNFLCQNSNYAPFLSAVEIVLILLFKRKPVDT